MVNTPQPRTAYPETYPPIQALMPWRTAPVTDGKPGMFEIGRIYKLQMLENGRQVIYWDCTVLAVEMPVVKFDHAGIREWIVNVSSPTFISAEPSR